MALKRGTEKDIRKSEAALEEMKGGPITIADINTGVSPSGDTTAAEIKEVTVDPTFYAD